MKASPKNNKGQRHLEIISMNTILYGVIILSVLSIFTSSHVSIFAIESAIESRSINVATNDNDFGKELKSKINNLISNALNDTGSVLNSTVLTNASNLTSNQLLISKNKVVATTSSNGSSGISVIRDKITTIDGVCNSEKVGGDGDDTLASSGNCNDQMTGGAGADKFTCGDGNDTIRDYNEEEGDLILDHQNCEKVL